MLIGCFFWAAILGAHTIFGVICTTVLFDYGWLCIAIIKTHMIALKLAACYHVLPSMGPQIIMVLTKSQTE